MRALVAMCTALCAFPGVAQGQVLERTLDPSEAYTRTVRFDLIGKPKVSGQRELFGLEDVGYRVALFPSGLIYAEGGRVVMVNFGRRARHFELEVGR